MVFRPVPRKAVALSIYNAILVSDTCLVTQVRPDSIKMMERFITDSDRDFPVLRLILRLVVPSPAFSYCSCHGDRRVEYHRL